MLIPKITYRLEGVTRVWRRLIEIRKLLKDMLQSIVGLPTFLCNKSLYFNPKFGIGLLHVPVVVVTRLLDIVEGVVVIQDHGIEEHGTGVSASVAICGRGFAG